ncbi:von Willebrand factor type A domain-containing protein [Ceratocystis lukuohia]|uniref:Vint domain-containing protein n=2 Tax=Ceratocystis TaxID=5157 RepID=A0A0F8B4J4_CERFI|nr:hypothetical protein CFO_g867 [Ceratocystis platani]
MRPSRRPHNGPTPTASTTTSSSSTITTPGAACFASSSLVTLASGNKLPLRHLRRGMRVQTPRGPRRVAALVMTTVHDHPVCDLHSVLVTAWHPVSREAQSWHFPRMVARGHGRYTGRMCSVLLEKDADPRAHAIWVSPAAHGSVRPANSVPQAPHSARMPGEVAPGVDAQQAEVGFWGVTLGHGVRKPSRYDVRAHPFFGNHAAVVCNLVSLGVGDGGVVLSGGLVKDRMTGLVTAFAPVTRRNDSTSTHRPDNRTVTMYVKTPNLRARYIRLVKRAAQRALRS